MGIKTTPKMANTATFGVLLFYSINKVIIRNAKNLFQSLQFKIIYIPFIRFNAGNDIFVHINAYKLQLTRQARVEADIRHNF